MAGFVLILFRRHFLAALNEMFLEKADTNFEKAEINCQ
jgi:hypothetical protein